MDWLTFFSKLIDSLAWPAVVVVVLLVFQKPISDRIRSIRRMKHNDSEIEFGDLLEETKDKATDIILPTNQELEEIEKQANKGAQETLFGVAKVSPAAAVIEAWKVVERATVSLHTKLGGKPKPGRDPVSQLLELQWRDNIEPSLRTMMKNLRQLRNRAAHASEGEISQSDAHEYVTLALIVVEALNRIEKDVNPT